MQCPICSKDIKKSPLCPVCGYDDSVNFEKYGSFFPVEGHPSVTGKRKQWEVGRWQDEALSPEERLEEIICGAKQGQPRAQIALYHAYKNGEGLIKNQDRALYWLKRAAEAGAPEAQKLLAEAQKETKPPVSAEKTPKTTEPKAVVNALPHGVIATEFDSIAAVTADGQVLTAGKPWIEGRTFSWSDVTSVALGMEHVVGLKADGTVVAAGKNERLYKGVSDWKDIKMVAAGWSHTVGLMKNGRVVATGHNSQKQCDVESWRNVVYLAANRYTTAGVTADGRVLLTGRLGDTCTWDDILSVALVDMVLVGLKKDGRVVIQTEKGEKFPEVSRWENIVAVAAGTFHVLGLKADGTVVAAAAEGMAPLLPCNVNTWYDIVAIAAGGLISCGIRKDGTLVACGLADGKNISENKAFVPWHSLASPMAYQAEKYMELASACLGRNARKQAYEWYVKAAELGHPKGQYNAGMCCLMGMGTPKDPVKAKTWLWKAAQQGFSQAEWALNKL